MAEAAAAASECGGPHLDPLIPLWRLLPLLPDRPPPAAGSDSLRRRWRSTGWRSHTAKSAGARAALAAAARTWIRRMARRRRCFGRQKRLHSDAIAEAVLVHHLLHRGVCSGRVHRSTVYLMKLSSPATGSRRLTCQEGLVGAGAGAFTRVLLIRIVVGLTASIEPRRPRRRIVCSRRGGNAARLRQSPARAS